MADITTLTRAALAVKAARGERTGSVPYGSRLAADGVHLEADAAEQAIVAVVRGARAEGLSLRAIADRLTAAGLLPRSGGTWHPPMIARMLTTQQA